MQFCRMCGTQMGEQDKFCANCGTVAFKFSEPVVAAQQSVAPVVKYCIGEERHFSLMGRELVVPASVDTFNTYRKAFRKFAKHQARALEAEYRSRIHDLDTFFLEFPKMYAKYRRPLLECAMQIILETGVFDLSAKQFEDQHTADFCLCGEDVDVMIDSFNETIKANQNRKRRMYNMMPGVIFRGVGGFAAALALNFAVTSIAEADIRNADVSQKQRIELFNRIDTDVLMERALIDYWRVFLSMTWQLNRKGIDVWYPMDSANESAAGLKDNLATGMLPRDRIPDLFIRLLNLNPYNDDPVELMIQHLGLTFETKAISDYFSADN